MPTVTLKFSVWNLKQIYVTYGKADQSRAHTTWHDWVTLQQFKKSFIQLCLTTQQAVQHKISRTWASQSKQSITMLVYRFQTCVPRLLGGRVAVCLFILIPLISKCLGHFYHLGTKFAWHNKRKIWGFSPHTHSQPVTSLPPFKLCFPFLTLPASEREYCDIPALPLFLHFFCNPPQDRRYNSSTGKPHTAGSCSPSIPVPLLLAHSCSSAAPPWHCPASAKLSRHPVVHGERGCPLISSRWSF